MPVPSRSAATERSLLREHAFRTLRAAIVDGTLEPGERLNDAELCAWLGVSRTPVREAIARLEQIGLVTVRPGSSTTVSPLDVRATVEAQTVAAAMHELAAREAVPALTAADLDAMTSANGAFAEALETGEVDAAIAADDAFHGVFVRVSGNRRLAAVLDDVTPLLRRMERTRFASLTGRASVAQHARIVELARAGDAEGAARANRENWLTLRPLDSPGDSPEDGPDQEDADVPR
ncbi:GntR family transcriptional regulator [Actinomycetospora cinnamomea]|uniref:DNA-binding GntR family transcriptional regulator n=1 Tax=Actinomycetospora cinnamomea TaxID=663609 RepID=A0A2U1FFX3_9PSEU|nr:GntR family transcriptional regulator [Actinomycetospora cinnamomea]PVZ11026.1 DNA-binding GntR family transcriptional regulator [Actinomycetospora cinnamomea]